MTAITVISLSTAIYFANVKSTSICRKRYGIKRAIKAGQLLVHRILGGHSLSIFKQKDSLWYPGNSKEITVRIINFRLSETDTPRLCDTVAHRRYSSSIDANTRN